MSEINLNSQTFSLPDDLKQAVGRELDSWQTADKTERLWRRGASVWTNEDEAKWLGWLDIIERQLDETQKFVDFAKEVRERGFTHILLLGMGGSSLAPEVLAMTFGSGEGFPVLHILDSTVPAQVRAVENKVDLPKTLFFVSSKSGSTLEPNVFKQYFFERVAEKVGRENAGKQFVAVTDPGSKMQQVAERDGFWRIFYGDPEIGGRFSALSDFGMIPAAAMGLDVAEFLRRAEQMAVLCKEPMPGNNPGVLLGTILGVCQKHGRDKLTIFASPEIHDLGAWLEQLIAESTGKRGAAIIPVDREPVLPHEDYGDDRVFVYLHLENAGDAAVDEKINWLEAAGHAVVRIALADKLNLGQEFFRWEMATAVAGAMLEINPFDQPDVEAAKIETRKLTDEYEKTGELPAETAFYEENNVRLFTDEKNARMLDEFVGGQKTLANYLRAHLARLQENDYFAVLAYIEMNAEHETSLQELRAKVLESKLTATCLGFGPRFLHSTGQAYKGGGNNNVFLQITSDDREDLPVPEQKFTFGVVKAAQARGDFQVLLDRERRALRVHLGADVSAGLETLRAAINQALG